MGSDTWNEYFHMRDGRVRRSGHAIYIGVAERVRFLLREHPRGEGEGRGEEYGKASGSTEPGGLEWYKSEGADSIYSTRAANQAGRAPDTQLAVLVYRFSLQNPRLLNSCLPSCSPSSTTSKLHMGSSGFRVHLRASKMIRQ